MSDQGKESAGLQQHAHISFLQKTKGKKMAPETDNILFRLISEEEIKQKLPSIFVDSIVVDQHFNIFTVSQNVLEMLEFTNDQLRNKNINYLSGLQDLATILKNKLKKGFCEEIEAILYNKSNRNICVGISGFYLGLVSDINGYIILKVTNLGEPKTADQHPEPKKVELDKFIYRAAHDLRGPLATIKGLINLIKMREDDFEIDRMVELLADHADKMDQRLFQLVYLAQVDHETELPTYVVDFKSIESSLRRVVEQNSSAEFMELLFSAPKKVINLNEVLLKNLLNNLLLHLLSLPKPEMKSRTLFKIERKEVLRVTVEADGFDISENLRKAMQHGDSIYTDVINYPQLINFYAAQKIVSQLNGNMQLYYSEPGHQIVVTLPLV